MVAITNYSSLVSAIINVTEDDGSEFADYIPTAINLAMNRMIRENDFPQLQSVEVGTIPSGSGTLIQPDDWEWTKYLYITVGTVRKLLRRKQEDFLIDYWPDLSILGEPKYYQEPISYAPSAADKMQVYPNADQDYPYTLIYVPTPVLDITNSTNYFTEKCPELLFHACMVECARFLKMWNQVQIWEQAYQTSRGAWNAEAQRQRRDNGETPHNPDGGPNTYLHTTGADSSS
jgi:hypothetical protein